MTVRAMPSRSPWVDMGAIVGTLAGVMAVHLLYRALKRTALFGIGDKPWTLNWTPGLVMAVVGLLLIVLSRRKAVDYGLGFPPSVGNARNVRKTRGVVLGLAYAVPLGIFLSVRGFALPAWLEFIGFLVPVAVGEEIFFRGYLQSTLNRVYGRTYQWRGIAFGPSLIITATAFGALHVLNTADLLAHRYVFSWGWGAATVVTGIIFGLIREAKASLWPAVIVHGLLDVWMVSLLLLLRSAE